MRVRRHRRRRVEAFRALRPPSRRRSQQNISTSPSRLTSTARPSLRHVGVGKESLDSLAFLGVCAVGSPVAMEQTGCSRDISDRLRRQPVEHRAQVVLLDPRTRRAVRLAATPTARARRPRAERGSSGRAGARTRRFRLHASSRSRAYSRIVSSRKKRSSPSGLSRLWSSSAATWSRSAPAIASAASSVNEPRNTDSRRNAAWASASSRSWLHSIVARSVRCRSGRSLGAAGQQRQRRIEPLQQRSR